MNGFKMEVYVGEPGLHLLHAMATISYLIGFTVVEKHLLKVTNQTVLRYAKKLIILCSVLSKSNHVESLLWSSLVVVFWPLSLGIF